MPKNNRLIHFLSAAAIALILVPCTLAIAAGGHGKAVETMIESKYFPADIDMPVTTSTGQTSVTFSHQSHIDSEIIRCMECHPRVFKMKIGGSLAKGRNMNLKEIQEGKYCGNCHDGERAFDITEVLE